MWLKCYYWPSQNVLLVDGKGLLLIDRVSLIMLLVEKYIVVILLQNTFTNFVSAHDCGILFEQEQVGHVLECTTSSHICPNPSWRNGDTFNLSWPKVVLNPLMCSENKWIHDRERHQQNNKYYEQTLVEVLSSHIYDKLCAKFTRAWEIL